MGAAARDLEAVLLARCVTVARAATASARDRREANVFRLAAMVVQSRFPRESAGLMQASQRYFAIHSDEKLHAVEVIQNGWVISLPRLRDRLEHLLSA